MSVLMYWVPVGALVIIAGIVAFTNISDCTIGTTTVTTCNMPGRTCI